MKDVIIYTATDCSHCHEAKEFFNEHNIPYTEHNISNDKEKKKELIKKGVMGVPFIIADGKEYRGFERQEFEKLI